jgi:glycerophosphoryl diester phosphodiesterase
MVFHDASLLRLTGLPGPVAAHTGAALARMRYRGQDTRILPFAELLGLVSGRVPLLVEVKVQVQGDPPGTFLDKIARLARAYPDPIALMSFDADVVAELGRLAPTIPRGLIAGSHQLRPRLLAGPQGARRGRMLDRILGTAPSGIAFFAIDVRILRGARAWMSRHAPELALFSWTIRTGRERAAAARWADAPIFEGYEA